MFDDLYYYGLNFFEQNGLLLILGAMMIPPAPLRSRFHELVAPLFAQIATIGLKIQNLRRTRDLVLPRLLSGQINLVEH